jgi:histone H3/H4
MSKTELSNAAIHRLIEKSGALRVGDNAVEELKIILEEVAVKVSREAIDLASHAGRKTVKAGDVRLAVKRLLRE